MPLTLSFNLQSLRFWDLRSLYKYLLKLRHSKTLRRKQRQFITSKLYDIEQEISGRMDLLSLILQMDC